MPSPSAMILCAGLGTRLRPLTEELPKPLVPIGDRPLLAHIVERLVAQGVRRIALNTHHLPEKFAGVIDALGVEAHVFHEPSIRGTAGGVAGARAVLAPGPAIVHNGDILAEAPVAAIVVALGSADLCLLTAPQPKGTGTVGLDSAGHVVRLRGERFGDEQRGGDYVGIAGVSARALDALPDVGCLIGDVALPMLRRGDRVATVPLETPWSDIGTIAAYHSENIAWLAAHAGELGSFTGAGARVGEGVRLQRSLIGAGATLTGTGALERCVVWPGATARAPLRDAIVTTGGRVVPVGDTPPS